VVAPNPIYKTLWSPLDALANPATQSIEIGLIGWSLGCGAGIIKEQGAQALSILIPADELTYVFAAGGHPLMRFAPPHDAIL